MKVKGTTLNGSVAVLRCRVPCSAGSVLVYHLLPKEYLADPPSSLPGLPANVSAEDFERLVPPPPLFRVGTTFWPGSKYHHAKHVDGLVTSLHPVRNRTHFPNDKNGYSPPNQKAGKPTPTTYNLHAVLSLMDNDLNSHHQSKSPTPVALQLETPEGPENQNCKRSHNDYQALERYERQQHQPH